MPTWMPIFGPANNPRLPTAAPTLAHAAGSTQSQNNKEAL
jgi:hypothetical protein